MEFNPYTSVIDVVVDSKLQYFKKSFESLLLQTVQDFELVLVIGYPGDEVRAYLETQSPKFNLVQIQEPQREKYPARASANNLGLDAATGYLYIGTQDDVIYPENWVESHIEWHKKPGGPYFIYNRVIGALTSGNQDSEMEFWERISNPAKLPITSRWQFGSGHSFSLPMEVAKKLRHDERFDGRWGVEDLRFSHDAHKAGCKFIIDIGTAVLHQDHGDRAENKWARDPDEFWQWLEERSINRRKFYELAGFCNEYGIVNNGFGYLGTLDLSA